MTCEQLINLMQEHANKDKESLVGVWMPFVKGYIAGEQDLIDFARSLLKTERMGNYE